MKRVSLLISLACGLFCGTVWAQNVTVADTDISGVPSGFASLLQGDSLQVIVSLFVISAGLRTMPKVPNWTIWPMVSVAGVFFGLLNFKPVGHAVTVGLADAGIALLFYVPIMGRIDQWRAAIFTAPAPKPEPPLDAPKP